MSDWQLKETIKRYLFRRGVDEEKTVVLIIDEGQKLPSFCLETLREFLNYETNEYKLLQIVIFAQKEFEKILENHQNFADRINLYHHLGPLNFQETRSMIQFRLDRASEADKQSSFFSFPALCVIYGTTKGYPRRIINLCHRIILTLIIQNRSRVGWSTARSCAKRVFPAQAKRWQSVRVGSLICILALMMLLGLNHGRSIIPKFWQAHDQIKAIAEEHEIPIVENEPLARSIYRTTKVGQDIPRELYQAVAEILALVYKKKRERIERRKSIARASVR